MEENTQKHILSTLDLLKNENIVFYQKKEKLKSYNWTMLIYNDGLQDNFALYDEAEKKLVYFYGQEKEISPFDSLRTYELENFNAPVIVLFYQHGTHGMKAIIISQKEEGEKLKQEEIKSAWPIKIKVNKTSIEFSISEDFGKTKVPKYKKVSWPE